jgi:3-oxoadipate enol-lactonase
MVGDPRVGAAADSRDGAAFVERRGAETRSRPNLRSIGLGSPWELTDFASEPFHHLRRSHKNPCALAGPMPDPTEAKTLHVTGGTIAYDEGGGGPPIVLLHEGIADRRMWNREFPLLARDHHVVRYDARGFGGSAVATSKYSPVSDLVALLDRAGMERPLIVGPSMGGKLALDLTLALPKRVGALLLIAPGYSGMDYDQVPGGKATFERDETLSRAAAEAWAAGNLEEATEHLRQLWASALDGSALELFRTMVRENAKEVFEERSGQFETREGRPAAGRLGEILVPTRILVGDRDNPAMPHCANFLARGIAGAKLQLIPGADHLLNLSRPDAFDTAVRESVNDLPRTRG